MKQKNTGMVQRDFNDLYKDNEDPFSVQSQR